MEQFWLGVLCFRLRTKKGIHLQYFKDFYGDDLFAEKRKILSKLQEERFISIRGGRLYPAPDGDAIADSLSLT